MLAEFQKKLDSVILRHETRYDVLRDFTPSHLSVLENFSYRAATQSAAKVEIDEGYIGHARAFVKDRCVYKRDHIECSMCLLCSTQLLDIRAGKTDGNNIEGSSSLTAATATTTAASNSDNNSSPKQKGAKQGLAVASSYLGTNSGQEKKLRPELFAANVSLHKSMSLKRKLGEHVNEYDSFLQTVDKHLENLYATSNDRMDGKADGNGALYLPLHDYGAYSQTTDTGAGVSDADAKGSLTSMQVKENSRVESLLESQLLKRLRGAMHDTLRDQQQLSENLFPSVTRRIQQG